MGDFTDFSKDLAKYWLFFALEGEQNNSWKFG